MRMKSFRMSLGTSFSSSGGASNAIPVGSSEESAENRKDTTQKKSIGERFAQRYGYKASEADLFGDSSPGYSPFSIPWSLNLDLSFNYDEPYSGSPVNRELKLIGSFNFSLTQTWNFGLSSQYDFIRSDLQSTTVNITKKMHCWTLTLTWYPIGSGAGFYLNFGIDASQLKDLKYEKRSSPIY